MDGTGTRRPDRTRFTIVYSIRMTRPFKFPTRIIDEQEKNEGATSQATDGAAPEQTPSAGLADDPGGERRKIDPQIGAGEKSDTPAHFTKKETRW